MAKLAAKVYGDGLFELALEKQEIDGFFEEVKVLSAVLRENDDLFKLMGHPQVPKEEKIQMIQDIFQGKFREELVGFLVLTAEKGRFSELESILDYFTNLVYEYKKIGKAQVTSAVPLTEAQKKATQERLLATTGYEQMEIQYQVDASLIGGMIVRIKDRVADNSIRSRLNTMTRDLLKIKL
jgi:F-type H+-transporting ATPase subunit delta